MAFLAAYIPKIISKKVCLNLRKNKTEQVFSGFIYHSWEQESLITDATVNIKPSYKIILMFFWDSVLMFRNDLTVYDSKMCKQKKDSCCLIFTDLGSLTRLIGKFAQNDISKNPFPNKSFSVKMSHCFTCKIGIRTQQQSKFSPQKNIDRSLYSLHLGAPKGYLTKALSQIEFFE